MYFSVASETYLSHFGQFQVVVRLTYRLKATVRRLFRYRLPPRALCTLSERKKPVLYRPLRSFSVLVLKFRNFGLQFPCTNVTLPSI